MGRVLTFLAGLLVLALIAVAVAPYYLDWNQYRAVIEKEISTALKLPVTISGPIELVLLPSPAVKLADVAIGPPGGQARISRVEAEFSIGALLKGELKAGEVRLDGPKLWLSLDRRGRFIAEAPATDWSQIGVDRLSISDGELTVEQEQRGARFFMNDITLSASALSLVGPWQAEGMGRFEGNALKLTLQTGRGDVDGIRAKISAVPVERPIAFDLDALFTRKEGKPAFSGALKLAGVGADDAASRDGGWRVEANVEAGTESFVARDIRIVPGGDDHVIAFNGVANLALGEQTRADLALSAKQIDLDHLAGASQAHPASLPAILTRLGQMPAALTVPRNLRLNATFDIGSVIAAGGLIQEAHAAAAFADGKWRFNDVRGQLPGQTNLSLSVRSIDGKRLEGEADINAQQPAMLARWIDGNLFDDKADKTVASSGALALKSHFSVEPTKLDLDGLKIGLPGAALSGRLSYDWGALPPRFILEGEADDIDAAPLASFLAPFRERIGAALSGETSFKLKAGRLRQGAFEARDLDLAVRRDEKGIALDHVTIGGLNGLAVSGSGLLDLSRDSALHVSLAGERLKPALDGLAAVLPSQNSIKLVAARAEALSPAKLDLDLKTVSGELLVRLAGEAGGSTIDSDASLGLQGLLEPSLSTLHIALKNASTPALLRQFGVTSGANLGETPAALSLDLKGAGDGTGVVSGEAELAGAKLALAGRITLDELTTLGPGLALALSSSDINPLLMALGGAPRRLDEEMPVSGKARLEIERDAIRLERLEGDIAGQRVSGDIAMKRADIPVLSGQIDVERLSLGWLLATLSTAPAAELKSAWSPAPFLSSQLPPLAGKIALTARALDDLPVAIANPRLTLAFRQASIGIEEAEGKLGEGRILGNLIVSRVEGKTKLAGRVEIEKASLALLPWRLRDGPAVKGEADLALTFEGSGRSPAELVGALQGGGRLAVRDGELAALSDKSFEPVYAAGASTALPDLKRLLPDVEARLDDGVLPFHQIETPVQLRDGVLRVSSIAPAGTPVAVKANAAIDLATLSVEADVLLEGKSAGQGSPGPRLMVSFSGPLEAPRRRLDVRGLGDYLNLRRFEGELARLEAIQKQIDEREKRLKQLQDDERARKEREASAPPPSETPTPTPAPNAEPASGGAEPASGAVTSPAPSPAPRPRPTVSKPAPVTANPKLRNLVEGSLRNLPDAAPGAANGPPTPLAPLPPPVVIPSAPSIGP